MSHEAASGREARASLPPQHADLAFQMGMGLRLAFSIDHNS